MFQNQDVADYYNTTQNHYEKWWNLKRNLSLHYGIWDENTRTFAEALANTNKIMMEQAKISAKDHVLDAGCGVGGAAFYVHQYSKAQVTGISLSTKQVDLATQLAQSKKIANQVVFEIMDYTKTSFEAGSFDVIWACESVCHANNKTDFIKESYRLLKKGGRLVLCDFFKTEGDQKDGNNWMRKWKDTWAIDDFASIQYFKESLINGGYGAIESVDFTSNVSKSARRMFVSGWLGALPSELYNLFHPKVSTFAKNHYKCGIYQYKALQEGLWTYQMVSAVKE